MSVAPPLPIGFFLFFWKLPPLALPRLLVNSIVKTVFFFPGGSEDWVVAVGVTVVFLTVVMEMALQL